MERRPFPEPDQLQRPHDIADLVVQERARPRLHDDLLVNARDLETIERPDRRLRLAERVAECAEIVLPHELPRTLLHRRDIERRVRALNPAPGVWFERGGERIKVLAAAVAENGAGAPPGTVLDAALTIACGSGALRPTRLQRAGRAAVEAEAFLRGYALPAGTRL